MQAAESESPHSCRGDGVPVLGENVTHVRAPIFSREFTGMAINV